MSARRTRARSVLLRWQVMPAVLISFAAGLGFVLPAQQAVADTAPLATSHAASSAGSASLVVAYVTNYGSGTVTPIATATNTLVNWVHILPSFADGVKLARRNPLLLDLQLISGGG
jgi:hypothetical protein